MVRRSRRHNSSRLRDLIRRSLEDCPGFGSRVEVDGKLNRITEGIWHDNYWFWIQSPKLSAAQTDQAYILRLLEQHEDWQTNREFDDR